MQLKYGPVWVSAACITKLRLLTLALVVATAAQVRAQESDPEAMPPNPYKDVKWDVGPAVAQIGNMAEIQVPEGYRFTGGPGTRKLLEAFGNPTNGSELGFLASNDMASNWFIVFQWEDSGYVKDDDKDALDADKMMESLREGNAEGNKERKRRGFPTLKLIGWEQPPKYDEKTNNLEWGIRNEDEQGNPGVNYNTRLLGRRGVMRVGLVLGPEELTATVPVLHTLLEGFTFKTGDTYADFRSGDKVAEYGLAALIAGGGAAAAIKFGFFQKFWKVLVVVVLGIGAFFKKIVGSLFGGGKKASSSTSDWNNPTPL